MKRCDYCGGRISSGNEVSAPDLIGVLHYSKISCAEFFKVEVERLKAAHVNCAFVQGTVDLALERIKGLELQIKDLMDALQVLEAAQSVPPAFRAVARNARERTMDGTNKISYEQFMANAPICNCTVGSHFKDCRYYTENRVGVWTQPELDQLHKEAGELAKDLGLPSPESEKRVEEKPKVEVWTDEEEGGGFNPKQELCKYPCPECGETKNQARSKLPCGCPGLDPRCHLTTCGYRTNGIDE